jgi:hypothetical protein
MIDQTSISWFLLGLGSAALFIRLVIIPLFIWDNTKAIAVERAAGLGRGGR